MRRLLCFLFAASFGVLAFAQGTDQFQTHRRTQSGSTVLPLSSVIDSLPVSIDEFSGSDIGAKINAILAAFPNGVEISIPPGNYTQTTPVVVTNYSYLRIQCLGLKGSVIIHDGITGAGAAAMVTIVGNTSNSNDLMIDRCQFKGNGLTGSSGNGHGIAILNNPTSAFAPIRVTLRDDSFFDFQGTGLDYNGSAIGASGVYASQGHILRSENSDYISNQYGMFLDSGFKVTVVGGDFDSNLHNGLFMRVVPNTVAENIQITSETIFNANGSGGTTDGGVYATNAYHVGIVGNRFKLNNPYDVLTGPDEITGLNIDDNHIFRSVNAGTAPSIEVAPSSKNARICGNSFFFEFTVSNAVGIKLDPTVGGFTGAASTICDNSAITSVEAGTSVDKWIWVAQPGVTLYGNLFGSDIGPDGGMAQTVNSVYYIDAGETVMIGNACIAGPNLTITNCVKRTVNASPFAIYSPTFSAIGGGVITNQVEQSAAIGGPRVHWRNGMMAVGAAVGDPTLPNGLEVQGTYNSPASSGTTPNGNLGITTPLGNNTYFGGYGSSPFAVWMQGQSQPAGLGNFYPLALNPLGGGVSIGRGNAMTPGLSLDLGFPGRIVPTNAASLPGCSSTYEGTWAAVTDATATSGALIPGGTNHVLVYCDGSGWQIESSAGSPVTSVFSRTGAVAAQSGDYNFSQIGGNVGCSQLPAGGGLTATVTVRNSAGSGTCTLSFSCGLYTGGTC